MALFITLLLGGCSHDLVALRNCDKSGEAHFGGYPLASRIEHEKAQQFTPDDPANCLLYVVREKDWFSGAKVDRTFLMLTPEMIEPRSLPANPALIKDQVIAIGSSLYAMWELPSRVYFLYAIFHNHYVYIHMDGLSVLQKNSIAQAQLDCKPGGLIFYAVGDRGFNHKIILKKISEDEGKIYVLNGLRSIGFREIDIGEEYRSPWHEELWYKNCPPEQQ
jgi:hypothetical protein